MSKLMYMAAKNTVCDLCGEDDGDVTYSTTITVDRTQGYNRHLRLCLVCADALTKAHARRHTHKNQGPTYSSVALPRFQPDERLSRLVADLIDHYPNLVSLHLFGSRAEGRAREDSDYDVLMVLSDDATAHDLDIGRAFQARDRADIVADIVPITQADFIAERDEPYTLAGAAHQRGHILYARTSAPRSGNEETTHPRVS